MRDEVHTLRKRHSDLHAADAYCRWDFMSVCQQQTSVNFKHSVKILQLIELHLESTCKYFRITNNYVCLFFLVKAYLLCYMAIQINHRHNYSTICIPL